jgi:hypothetical protein
MRTFAQKPKAIQRIASAKSTITGRAHCEQSREANSILHLQRTSGNQAVQLLLWAKPDGLEAVSDATAPGSFGYDFSRIPLHDKAAVKIQPKLAVNAPGDIYEEEADRVSEQVMRMPEPQLQQHACPCGGGCHQCQTAQQDHEHECLQTKRVQASNTGQIAAPPIVHEVLAGPGQPLDPATRAFFEPRFGYDFSTVRVHTDMQAAQSAQTVHGLAYTVGQHLVFGAGQYAPSTQKGRQLLGHELVHVLQQGSGSQRIQRGGKLIELTPKERYEWDVAILRGEIERFNTLSAKEQLSRIDFIFQLLRGLSSNPYFATVDPLIQQEITDHITTIESTLSAFAKAQKDNLETVEESNFSWAAMGGVAVLDGPEPGPADAVALLYAAGVLLFGGTTATIIARDPGLPQRQAEALNKMLNDVRGTLTAAVLMTAVGGVLHDHIVNEAKELAIALGLAATAGEISREVLCQMLRKMAQQNRRSDTEKWKKIIATEKGLGCRGSRANRE